MAAPDRSQFRALRSGGLVAICAVVALLVAMVAPSQADAARLSTRSLDDFRGNLPPPWVLEPQTASFRRSGSGAGFRVKPAR